MSELRDMTNALRALAKRLDSVEDCLLVLVRNSEQQAEWRHEQRGLAQTEELFRAGQVRAMKQVQDTVGAISHRLVEVFERFDAIAANRLADMQSTNARIQRLEPDEEVTKP